MTLILTLFMVAHFWILLGTTGNRKCLTWHLRFLCRPQLQAATLADRSAWCCMKSNAPILCPSVALAPPLPSWSLPAPQSPEASVCLGPPDPPCRPGSSALCLRPGLLSHPLRRRRSAPWSRQPFLHHVSSLHRLHRRSSSWLGSGTSPVSSCSGLLLGSSLYLFHPGSSLRHCCPGCLPAFLPALCHPLSLSLCCLLTIFFSAVRGSTFWEGERSVTPSPCLDFVHWPCFCLPLIALVSSPVSC